MTDLTHTLRTAADTITQLGLHRGPHFTANNRLDLCAAVYLAAEGSIPDAFATNPHASRDLIEASPDAMAAIVALSNSLDTEPSVTETDGGTVTDYVEHLAGWTDNPGVWGAPRPSDSEVVGRLLRLANDIDARMANRLPHAA